MHLWVAGCGKEAQRSFRWLPDLVQEFLLPGPQAGAFMNPPFLLSYNCHGERHLGPHITINILHVRIPVKLRPI